MSLADYTYHPVNGPVDSVFYAMYFSGTLAEDDKFIPELEEAGVNYIVRDFDDGYPYIAVWLDSADMYATPSQESVVVDAANQRVSMLPKKVFIHFYQKVT